MTEPTAAGGCLPDSLEYCVFKVGTEEYGIASSQVLGLCMDHWLTEPASDLGLIRGSLNWQGTDVPVLDLRMLLNPAVGSPDGSHPVIVVRTAGGKVGVLVEQVLDAVQASASQVTPLQQLLQH